MKDNSAFLENVFDKSEKIFQKRKKRMKVAVSLLSTSACFLLVFGFLIGFPSGKKAFDAEFAPTDNYYSDKIDGDAVKEDAPVNNSQSDIVKIPEREIVSIEEIPSLEEKMPTMVEVKNFSSTVSIYMAKNDIVEIKEALEASFEEIQDAIAVGKITFFYEDEKLSIYVGNEFFNIYK